MTAHIGLAWKTGLKEKQTHILDRGTLSGFVKKQGDGRLSDTLKHYLDLVPRDGVVTLLSGLSGGDAEIEEELRKLINEGKVHVAEHEVSDRDFSLGSNNFEAQHRMKTAYIIIKL